MGDELPELFQVLPGRPKRAPWSGNPSVGAVFPGTEFALLQLKLLRRPLFAAIFLKAINTASVIRIRAFRRKTSRICGFSEYQQRN